MEFKTSSNRSGLIGLAVAGGFLAGAIALVIALVSHLRAFQGQPVSPLTLGLMLALVVDLAALALLLYGSIAALRLHYQLDRNGLVICWRGSRLVIPMDRIQAIQPASQVGITDETVAFRGIAWAGLRVGQGRLSDDRLARMYATLPLDQSTVVSTPDGAYLLSPHNPTAFVEAWRVRRPLGPTQRWREEQRWVWPFNLRIWHDRMAWGLVVAGLLINFILHSYLVFILDRLPDRLPFHFNVLGQADLIASRGEIFRFPRIALLMLMIDVVIGLIVYRRVQVASYLIWGGGILLQLLAAAAVLTIIGRAIMPI